MALRSDTGLDIVSQWIKTLPSGGTVLELGCGFGAPISMMLIERGFDVCGVEPSPKLAAEFKRRLPGASIACEAAEASAFFGKPFDAVLTIGIIFILAPDVQRSVIKKVEDTLKPEGRFLFTAPRQICDWQDTLTGRMSWSLGEEEYKILAANPDMSGIATHVDDGENHYYEMFKDNA